VVKVRNYVATHYAVFFCLLSIHPARLQIFTFKTRINNQKLPGNSSSPYTVSSVTNGILKYCDVADMTATPPFHMK